MTKFLASIGFLVLLVSGCTPKEFNEPGTLPSEHEPTRRALPGSYSAVWDATLATLRNRKYPIATSQRDGGVIITDWIMGKSDRLYSGYGETRIPYNIRFKFTIRLHPSKAGVDVNIVNEEQYYSDAVTAGSDFSGSLYQWIPTQTSTAKEAAFLDEVSEILRANRPKK